MDTRLGTALLSLRKMVSYRRVSIRAKHFSPDSAVESEAQSKAQAFRSERNGPVPLSQVASSGAMSGVLNHGKRSAE